ncbi:hypothetical protein [Brucella intermedia]|uniref:hypothetical protein n=1 Tax=Brucella intermedia TaxID=94625 RepID=UPI00224ABB55|nr:hypothetical protein [Brucella intermedia]
MKNETISISEKTELLANLIGNNFLKLARELRDLKENAPDLFLKVAEMAGISSRKAYALARISRQFDELGVSEERLAFIGWTKLQIVGRHLNDENGEYLLDLAEQHTTHDLETILRGETPAGNAKVVQFYLTHEDYQLLRSVLLKHGALVNGNGLAHKEEALMAAINSYHS